jgi:hypothetical protein
MKGKDRERKRKGETGVRKEKEEGKRKGRRRCGARGILLYCWWECKLVQPPWK